MAVNGIPVFDSDLHVIEPADLWQRYIDPKFRDLAPMGRPEKPFSTGNLLDHAGNPFVPGNQPSDYLSTTANHCADQARRRGRYDQYMEFESRNWDASTQLEAMDAEGVDAAVLFPTRGLAANGTEYTDDQFAAAVVRAYNDWLADFCAADPNRLFGAAMIHPQAISAAVDEIRRAARELGFKGIYLRPNPVRGRNWHDPAYDPLWAACQQEGLLVGFHEGYPCTLPHAVAERFDGRFEDFWLTEHVTRHPIEMMYAATCMINGGVLARFPDLRVAFLEANCSWAPYWMWRMDEHYEIREHLVKDKLPERPSVYFLRQCFVSIEADEECACPVIDRITNNVVFSTDYPHSDSAYPRATRSFLELPMDDAQRRRILWDNCCRMYGFTPQGTSKVTD